MMRFAPHALERVTIKPTDIDVAEVTIMTEPPSWEALFGCPRPQRLAGLVEQAVAWREQMLRYGDVSAAVAHDLQLAAEHALAQRGVSAFAGQPNRSGAIPIADGEQHADEPPADYGTARSRGSAGPGAPVSQPPGRSRALPPATSQLLPGSQLVKAHGGRNHVVRVEEGGFRYEGALFASLSAVARHITGTHWNGLLFFGLRKRRTYPAKPRRHG